MFATNDVFTPTKLVPKIDGPVRVVDTIGLQRVLIIAAHEAANSVPFTIDYSLWLEYIRTGALEKSEDPYLRLSSMPGNLPSGAAKRYKKILKIAEVLGREPSRLHTPRRFAAAIEEFAQDYKVCKRTIKVWICSWLKFGFNPVAVVRKFERRDPLALARSQMTGKKRGITARIPEFASEVPSQEVIASITTAWNVHVIKQKKKWSDAYHDLLIDQYRIPKEAFSPTEKGYFLDRSLIDKYRAPTWLQTRYRFRQLKAASSPPDSELPQGSRGKATDEALGPGFFEIDATHFQVQLVSRLSKSKLVGRPTVYLIVDIFSDAVVGYSVTLENPSWATAALALYACFSDKKPIFDRLGLPYDSDDWPCRELPNLLRADRAELVSNMGQDFPSSFIRVEIVPPMDPKSKGTVEGKHSEIKKPQPGRFDLPGRFSKIRKRRTPDGKKHATLDIFEFEQILVEIIMDINREPVQGRRIPPDALLEGPAVASRIGLYKWGLEHRPGFTREMPPNFIYEHLLTKANGVVTPAGIHVKAEIFNCDRLRELGYLATSINNEVKLTAVYHPLLASEIYFKDWKSGRWERSYNIDPEIEQLKASFAEARNYRAWQETLTRQAALNAHGSRRGRLPFVRGVIRDAAQKRRETATKVTTRKENIREYRADERTNERQPVLSNVLVSSPSTVPTENMLPGNIDPAQLKRSSEFKDLWKEVQNARAN